MDKYDAHDHIAVLTELTVLYKVANETQTKISDANERLKKSRKQKRWTMKSPFNQKFDIDVYFTIKYFAQKHNKTITRSAKWTKDCEYGTHKKHGYPYIRYFDVDANGIRCASKSWEILEVRK